MLRRLLPLARSSSRVFRGPASSDALSAGLSGATRVRLAPQSVNAFEVRAYDAFFWRLRPSCLFISPTGVRDPSSKMSICSHFGAHSHVTASQPTLLKKNGLLQPASALWTTRVLQSAADAAPATSSEGEETFQIRTFRSAQTITLSVDRAVTSATRIFLREESPASVRCIDGRTPHCDNTSLGIRYLDLRCQKSMMRPSFRAPDAVPRVRPPALAPLLHFQSETRRILDIVTHSLYTEREIFLRGARTRAGVSRESGRASLSVHAPVLLSCGGRLPQSSSRTPAMRWRRGGTRRARRRPPFEQQTRRSPRRCLCLSTRRECASLSPHRDLAATADLQALSSGAEPGPLEIRITTSLDGARARPQSLPLGRSSVK